MDSIKEVYRGAFVKMKPVICHKQTRPSRAHATTKAPLSIAALLEQLCSGEKAAHEPLRPLLEMRVPCLPSSTTAGHGPKGAADCMSPLSPLATLSPLVSILMTPALHALPHSVQQVLCWALGYPNVAFETRVPARDAGLCKAAFVS